MHRRMLLSAMAAFPLLAVPSTARASRTKQVVGSLEIVRLRVNKRGNWIIVRLTAGDLTGLGDASHGGHDEETMAALRRFAAILKGRSIFDVEWFLTTARAKAGPDAPASARVAISALEQCLWDLIGKALGVPVWRLFGGKVRGSIRLYANINRSSDPRTPAGFAAMARRAVAEGFTAVKLAPFDAIAPDLADAGERSRLTAEGIACAVAVREAIGPDRDLLIDAHSRFGVDDGLALARRMEPLNLYWLEEVTPAEPPTDLARINREAKMPTAGGEAIYGVSNFYRYIREGAVDIVMPDVKLCGGVLELRKIAALAEGAGLPVSPHGPASPIGTIAAAHAMAGISNFTILEFSFGEVPWRSQLVGPAEKIVDGHLPLDDRPGFGIELNPAIVAQNRI